MNKMKIIPLLFMSYFLGSCSSEIKNRYYNDPFSGERVPAKTASIDGWTITTIGKGNLLILSKGQQNFVAIADSQKERRITVFSPSDPLNGAATLIDEGADLMYESITYGDGKRSLTDIALDGTPDGIINFDKNELLVNYKGNLYPFIDQKGNRHIVVNGKQIPMVYKYGTFVPNK